MISVVMAVYNAALTLTAALESLVRQTEPGWELIAVDDGSTDASSTILEAWGRRDRRIRLIRAERRGVVAALNTGLATASSSLIARLDADDLCLPERLARQRRCLEAHPEVGLVASRVHFGGDTRRAAGYARYVSWTNRLLTHRQISLGRFVESPLAHPSVMFRRELVERWGRYEDGDFPEDYEHRPPAGPASPRPGDHRRGVHRHRPAQGGEPDRRPPRAHPGGAAAAGPGIRGVVRRHLGLAGADRDGTRGSRLPLRHRLHPRRLRGGCRCGPQRSSHVRPGPP